MNEEIKAQWLAALRSGDYHQGAGCLRSGDAFCCLGVLTDLAVKAGVVEGDHAPESGHHYYGVNREGFGLPDEVRVWAGMKDDSGHLPSPLKAPCGCGESEYHTRSINSLVSMNDSGQYSFDQIADVIEAQF